MIQCVHCSKETNNPKFCSMSCSAKYNNKQKPKRKKSMHSCVCGEQITKFRKYCKECFRKQTKDENGLFCLVCNKELIGRQSKFCTIKCKLHYNFSLIYKKLQTKGLERKRAFINQLGGKCSICGYDKNLAVLSFHHKNPQDKSFGLDMRTISNLKMETLQKEVDKCQLLCLNCHTELHHPNLDKFVKNPYPKEVPGDGIEPP